MLKEPKRRVRFLERHEAQRLLACLPKHLADMALFTLATGLRRGNVTGLQWSQVDLDRRVAWIHADQAKGGRAIAVPLNAQAVAVVQQRVPVLCVLNLALSPLPLIESRVTASSIG